MPMNLIADDLTTTMMLNLTASMKETTNSYLAVAAVALAAESLSKLGLTD